MKGLNVHGILVWFKKGLAFAILAFFANFLLAMVFGSVVTLENLVTHPSTVIGIALVSLVLMLIVDGFLIEKVDKHKLTN